MPSRLTGPLIAAVGVLVIVGIASREFREYSTRKRAVEYADYGPSGRQKSEEEQQLALLKTFCPPPKYDEGGVSRRHQNCIEENSKDCLDLRREINGERWISKRKIFCSYHDLSAHETCAKWLAQIKNIASHRIRNQLCADPLKSERQKCKSISVAAFECLPG